LATPSFIDGIPEFGMDTLDPYHIERLNLTLPGGIDLRRQDKAMLDFMNSNWRMIAEEFGNPMVDYGVARVMKNLRRLLKIIPLNQIILEPVDL
ncbi:Takeout/JHBP like protein, partial [Operophtera brumata]